VALAAAGCSNGSTPTTPTTVVTAAPPLTPANIAPPATGAFTIAMPLDAVDAAGAAYGLAPFGYHDAGHAEGGHPGWDVEFRQGGIVRAAADGTVEFVTADESSAGRQTVQVWHRFPTHEYRTVYTNLSTVAEGIEPGTVITQGRPLGTAGSVTGNVGTSTVTYAMTHFQLDDFDSYYPIPNPNAVGPLEFLNASGRATFDRIWLTAHFVHELTEPFAVNPRSATAPMSRTWRRESGDGPYGVTFTRASLRSAEYRYAVLAESGVAFEAGTVTLGTTTRPFPTIDLVTPTGPRLGVYDIVNDRMRLALGVPGGARPSDLSSASVYRTAPALPATP
jgi:murein DD-endopeptidase MepM/ murein hydrolase activator NlpD